MRFLAIVGVVVSALVRVGLGATVVHPKPTAKVLALPTATRVEEPSAAAVQSRRIISGGIYHIGGHQRPGHWSGHRRTRSCYVTLPGGGSRTLFPGQSLPMQNTCRTYHCRDYDSGWESQGCYSKTRGGCVRFGEQVIDDCRTKVCRARARTSGTYPDRLEILPGGQRRCSDHNGRCHNPTTDHFSMRDKRGYLLRDCTCSFPSNIADRPLYSCRSGVSGSDGYYSGGYTGGVSVVSGGHVFGSVRVKYA